MPANGGAQRITHRHPGLLSSPSPCLLPLLPPLAAASSSSSMSWGLTVMCTTLGVSWLSFESRFRNGELYYLEDVEVKRRGHRDVSETGSWALGDQQIKVLPDTYLSEAPCRRGASQTISVLSNPDSTVWLPILDFVSCLNARFCQEASLTFSPFSQYQLL